MTISTSAIIGGSIAFVVIIIALFIWASYIKSPSNVATIITGFRKMRIVIGKSAIRIPFLERADKLPLELIQVNVETSSAIPTSDFINVRVDSVATFQIGMRTVKDSHGMITNPNGVDESLIRAAASAFLNCDISDISGKVTEILQGSIREIVGKMELVKMINDRETFNKLVMENAEKDLNSIGCTIKTFNVQNFTDNDHVIENLGIDNIVAISKSAAISKANANKDIATAQAEADKLANDARVASETEIAIKNNELAIKQAELKIQSDIKKAEADAAYSIRKAEKDRNLNQAEVDAQIMAMEKTIELQQKQASVQEQKLNAEVCKKADAVKYEIEKQAEAELFKRQKDAEAKKIEQQKQAEALKIKAEADKYAQLQDAEAVKAKGEAEAAAILAKGNAEAEAIKQKGLAEAEALKQRAMGLKENNEAMLGIELIKQLPEIAKAIGEPLSKIGNITMYGEGCVGKTIGEITTSFQQVIQGVQGGTGINLGSVLGGMLGGKMGSSNNPIPAEVDAEAIAKNIINEIKK
ncbi:MAG: flotillin family protein [Paludibacteraceae bacterium]|nr:flotillin family protein [Paludibacteraceae bacterium]